jgi:riboflavin biosynthesis pyrimidine reductase
VTDGPLRRQVDGGGRGARDLVAALGLRDPRPPGARPRVAAAMIASADGRAAVQGRSVALGHPADRALLRELRTGADAILVGAATMEAERYATVLDPEQRAHRAASGEPEHPLVATISRRLDLSPQIPILDEAGVDVLIFTESDGPAPEGAARIDVHRFAPGTLTITAVLEELGRRGVRGVACEGGPSLLRELVAAGGLDDLLLTVAPLLAAGDAPSIVEGDALPTPARLALRAVHRADDHVFLHYGAGA